MTLIRTLSKREIKVSSDGVFIELDVWLSSSSFGISTKLTDKEVTQLRDELTKALRKRRRRSITPHKKG